jgi:hypothetical protein
VPGAAGARARAGIGGPTIARNRFVWAPLIVLLLGAALTQLPVPAWPISADDRPAIARAYRALTGRDADPRWVCGLDVPAFPDVIALGEFAYDRGCAVIGVVVANRPLDIARGTVAGLARAGWSAAAPAERSRLALAWTRGALLAWRNVLDQAPEVFARRSTANVGAPAFEPPKATSLPDGGARVELWVQEPSGMLPQYVFSRIAFTFGPSGTSSAEQRLDGFTVPIR